jgi:phosphoglycerate dehydrogenase-like enzyme
MLSGVNSVREWCAQYDVPLMWILPNNLQKAFGTLLDVQKNNHTMDTAVVSAISELRNMDNTILTDRAKIDAAFLETVGTEYADIWYSNHQVILANAKIRFGNDMSTWTIADMGSLQRMLKKAQQEKAKKEKLAGTKNRVRNMNDTALRDRVVAFLDNHPEFCDDFAE